MKNAADGVKGETICRLYITVEKREDGAEKSEAAGKGDSRAEAEQTGRQSRKTGILRPEHGTFVKKPSRKCRKF